MSGEVDVTVAADCKEVVEALEALEGSVDMVIWIHSLFFFWEISKGGAFLLRFIPQRIAQS